jgi:hypothetical protein
MLFVSYFFFFFFDCFQDETAVVTAHHLLATGVADIQEIFRRSASLPGQRACNVKVAAASAATTAQVNVSKLQSMRQRFKQLVDASSALFVIFLFLFICFEER